MSASDSPTVQSLLPAAAVAAEMREPGGRDLLYPEESATLSRAVDKRVGEFVAGRLCARAALARFGIVDFPLRVARDRLPVWPDGMIGSITHTTGFYAAAVAARRDLSGIGIDSELLEALSPPMLARICVPAEIAWIASLPELQRVAAAMFIFSAKEAFYKCQFPLTGEWLGFSDVCIDALPWRPPPSADATAADSLAVDGCATEFLVKPTRALALEKHASATVLGRYRFHEHFVSTAVALPAG